MMHAVLYHLGSGDAFFSGSALILVALAAAVLPGRPVPWFRRTGLVVGGVLVALSGTPLPLWAYGCLIALTLACLLSPNRCATNSQFPRLSLLVACVAWVAADYGEFTYRMWPTIPRDTCSRMAVIGDSLSAGEVEGQTSTWPQIVAQASGLLVSNYAVAGATTSSACAQATRLCVDEDLAILEIGGNDLLGATTTVAFEQDLDSLLTEVCVPGRTVLMFELPLLPLCHGYGRAQRRLCERFGVYLIPKRVLLGVLLDAGTTTDSLHLSATGQQKLADQVWEIIQPGVSPRPH